MLDIERPAAGVPWAVFVAHVERQMPVGRAVDPVNPSLERGDDVHDAQPQPVADAGPEPPRFGGQVKEGVVRGRAPGLERPHQIDVQKESPDFSGSAWRGPKRLFYRQDAGRTAHRSEEHTSELQSRQYLVCRL